MAHANISKLYYIYDEKIYALFKKLFMNGKKYIKTNLKNLDVFRNCMKICSVYRNQFNLSNIAKFA